MSREDHPHYQYLSDHLSALANNLTPGRDHGLTMHAPEVRRLISMLRSFANRASELENENSQLNWNLNSSRDAIAQMQTLWANGERPELLSTALEAADDPNSNVSFLHAPSLPQKPGGSAA